MRYFNNLSYFKKIDLFFNLEIMEVLTHFSSRRDILRTRIRNKYTNKKGKNYQKNPTK